MNRNTQDKVDRLLHDAERAGVGSAMARMLGDGPAERRLATKRDKLYAAALALDPEKTAPAWEEV
jgi:hypothetical protein